MGGYKVTFKYEYKEFLDKYSNEIPVYFQNIILSAHEHINHNNKKKIVVLGDNFYGIYIKAMGAEPVYLNGGSYQSLENASDVFPQISDPIAKCAVGMLLEKDKDFLSHISGIILSISNDSMKKSNIYLRELGIPLIIAEPPSYLVKQMPQNFAKSQHDIIKELQKACKSHIDLDILYKEITLYKKIEELGQELKLLNLPEIIKVFLMETAFLALDKNMWCKEMDHYIRQANHKLFKIPKTALLLTGSPIVFPNYKTYKIIDSVGIKNYQNNCFRFPKFHLVNTQCKKEGLLKNCFEIHYINSFSSGTIKGTGEYNFNADTKAVLYHLLKGQLYNAYEAQQMEKSAIRQNIPFLCVETDYTKADKEQIKIRIEAFAEMIKKEIE